MTRGLRIRFRRAHDDDLPLRNFREEVRAEVVVAHVRGEDDCAAVVRFELIEILVAFEIPVRRDARLFEAHVVRHAPGEVPEDSIRAPEIHER